MFTLPTGTPGAGFVTATTRVPANWFNYVSNNYPNAVDGVGGGYYQLTGANLRFCSSNRIVKFNQADASFPLELRGYVTIGLTDEADYATGVGTLTVAIPATFSAAVTFSGAMTYSSTVAFNGAVTFGSGGDITLSSGCAVTAASGSSITVQSGSTLTLNSGSTTTFNGTTTFASATTFDGAVELNAATQVDADVTLTTGVDVLLSPVRTYSRVCKPVSTVATSTWAASADPEIFPYEIAQINTTNETFRYLADVPDGATITSVTVTLDPAGAHGALPASMPKIYLYKFNVNTRTKTLVTTYTDVATLPDYENQRIIQTATVSTTRDAAVDVYVVLLEGESGANSLNGLQFAAPVVFYTRGKLGED
jgi:hypothetical protein